MTHSTARELAAAGLPGLPTTESAIIRMAKREGWNSRKRAGRGGGVEYDHASLPAAARKRLSPLRLVKDDATDAAEKERQRQEARAQSVDLFDKLPAKKQQAAQAKLAVIMACNHYLASHRLAKFSGQNSFTYEYNLGRIDIAPGVRAEIRQLHAGTLRNWIKQEHELGVMGLVDCYGNRKDQSKIETWRQEGSAAAPMAATIQALILEFPHITEKKCNEALRGLLLDAPRVSDKSVKRYMAKWKRNNAQQYALACNPDNYKNRMQPAFGSRSEGIDGPNQLWEIDATPADLLLTDGRYKIIGICDVGPRRLKYYVTKTEKARDNAWVVRNCLLDWGVPADGTLATDQGSAYIGDHFTRVLRDLNIHQHICNPFSGDEKPHVERSFRTYSHDLIELTPGYCGHSVADRKEIEARKSFAQRLMTRGEEIAISLSSSELQAFTDRWIANYHNAVHSSIKQTPNQAVAAWPHPIQRLADERALDILLAEAVRKGGKLPIIGKKGIRVGGGVYIHPALGNHVGEYCRAFQDPSDLGRIIVHLMNEHDVWEFACIAEDPARTGISMTEVAQATRQLHNEHKKEMTRLNREIRKELKGVDVVDAVMTYREKEAAERQANVTLFPRPSVEYTSPGLTAAAAARAALDGTAKPVTPVLTPAQQEIKERIKAEFAGREASNVRSLEVESARARYKRMKGWREVLASGGTIGEEDYKAMVIYEQSNEYRVFKGLELEVAVK